MSNDQLKKAGKDQEEAVNQQDASDQLPEYEEDAEEDFNSTMMAIDVSKLNMDQTKTGLRIEDEKTPPQTFAESHPKKSWKDTLKSWFQSKVEAGQPKRKLPDKLQKWQGVWICDLNQPVFIQVAFYLFRVFLLIAFAFLQIHFIDEISRSFETQNPLRYPFLFGYVTQAIIVAAVLMKRMAPTWILVVPLTLLTLIMANGAIFYHTADQLYYQISSQSISEYLNSYYLFVLLLSGVITVSHVVKNQILRIVMAALYGLSLLPFLINFYQETLVEYAFFGAGFLQVVPGFFLQPQYISMHFLLPVVFLVTLYFSFSSTTKGVAGSLAVLLFTVLILNFSLMQKNRVFHVFNLVVSKRLSVGAAEVKHANQNLKIETKNFKEYEGLDLKARYRFQFEDVKKKQDVFDLTVVDAFGFPVRFLTKSDFVVFSDDQKIEDFSFEEVASSSSEGAKYRLKIKLQPQEPLLKWQPIRGALSSKRQFVFDLTHPEKVNRLVIKRNEDVLLEVVEPKKNQVTLPLYYFQPGRQEVNITMYDELNQEIYQKDLTLNIRLDDDFNLISPLNGDHVGEQVGVLLQLQGIKADEIKNVQYYLNDQLVEDVSGMSYFHTLDLSQVPEGEVKLTVKAILVGREITHDVNLKKGATVPKLMITEPTMGVFAERQTTVSYQLDQKEAEVDTTQVYVNGNRIEGLQSQNSSFEIPVNRWEESEIYVAVQLKLKNGTEVSDWVQINRGMSALALNFDAKSLSFINVKKVAVLLDASVSSWDNWQKKSKWHNMTNLILAPEVESRLKNLNPSLFVFGQEKPFYFRDCADVTQLNKRGDYNKATLKRKLEAISPKGVSALSAALKQAYRTKPEKIFVFADSSDTCQNSLISTLRSVMKKSPETVVHVFSLGRVATQDRQDLMKLAEQTGGHYYQPDDYDTLRNKLLEELSLNYELYSQGKQIYQSPLENKEFRLGPGQYTLKIPYGSQIKEIDINLEHATKTTLNIQGQKSRKEEEQIKVEKVISQM